MTSAISVVMSAESPGDDVWQQLLTAVLPEHRFLSPLWYAAWARAFLPMDRWKGPLRWLVARNAELGVTGIIPLAQQRIGAVGAVSLGGYYWPFRMIPLAAGLAPQTSRAIVQWANSHSASRIWRFGPIPRGNPAVESLIDAFSLAGWRVMQKRVGETYAVNVDEQSHTYEQERASLIKKVTYYERRMNRSGNVHVRSAPVGDDEFRGRLLGDMEAIEARSWVSKQDDGKPKFLGERNQCFWKHLAESSTILQPIRPMVLYLDDRPISYSLNIDAGTTRYIVANGYDDEFNSHSPGMVLAYHVIRDASRSGRSIIEWGLGDSGYKSRWGAREHLKLVDLLVLPRSPIGYLATRYLEQVAGYAKLG